MFKTSRLYNVARTAPDMHNGVLSTLEEMVDFYNDSGGGGLNVHNQDAKVVELDLNEH